MILLMALFLLIFLVISYETSSCFIFLCLSSGTCAGFFIIDFLDIVSGDDDFFFIERFLSIEVFDEGQSFF
jgi:hypothetical protein